MRYLAGTFELKLRYGPIRAEGVEGAEGAVKGGLVGYIDSACADCLDTRSSTFGYIFVLWNESINWSSKRQISVSMSVAEAEYVDECYAFKEVTFLVHALKEVGYEDQKYQVGYYFGRQPSSYQNC